MMLRTVGDTLVDEHDRQRLLQGINLVAKGRPGSVEPADFRGDWSAEDLEHLAGIGLDSIRLGVNWAATEPAPGQYAQAHLEWLGDQLDLAHGAGLSVILDGHQDLYSQSFGNGAPAWASSTQHSFTPSPLWSDAYLESPAVHEAYDAFWADAPGPGGTGIQTRFVSMWGMLAEQLGPHPAVIGYDALNEPTPGAASAHIFETILATFAALTGQDPMAVAADFTDPQAKLAQLVHLDDPALHRRLRDELAPRRCCSPATSASPRSSNGQQRPLNASGCRSSSAIRALLTVPVAGVQMVLFMTILTAGGHEAGAAMQSASTQEAIHVATAGVPILFALVGLVPLAFLPYSRAREVELSQWSWERRPQEGTAVDAPVDRPEPDADGTASGAPGTSGPG